VRRIGIPRLVRGDFFEPELHASLGGDEMFRTAVPEAPIHEDVQVCPRECDVCTASAVERQGMVDSEPESAGVKY